MTAHKVDPALRVTKSTYKRTLAVVNKLRKRAGLKPLVKMPKGVPSDSEACPIFYALQPCGVTEVNGDELTVEMTSKLDPALSTTETTLASDMISGGEVFQAFVEEFDNDELACQ